MIKCRHCEVAFLKMIIKLKWYRAIGLVMLVVLLMAVPFGMKGVWAESVSSEGAVVGDETMVETSEEEMPAEDVVEEPVEGVDYITYTEKARVLTVVDRIPLPEEQITKEQTVQLEILTGKFKGQITETINVLSGNSIYERVTRSWCTLRNTLIQGIMWSMSQTTCGIPTSTGWARFFCCVCWPLGGCRV